MKTILLVEDNPDDKRIVLNILEKNNVTNEVVVASDGETALEKLLGEDLDGPLTPDLILLDLRLPGMDGLEVLRRLRAHEMTKTVPVVVLTGIAGPSEIRCAYELGANSVVIKPTNLTQFGDVILNTTMYWLLINRTAAADLVPSEC